jgi:poly(hydroxyalkanoate) granule-associated protein
MVKQTKTRKVPSRPASEFSSRDLLLAGLGAASLTRKQGIRLYGTLLQEGRAIQGRASHAVTRVSHQINHGLDAARDGLRTRVAPLRGRARDTLSGVRDELAERLQPMLARLGIARAPKKRATSKQVAPRKVAVRRVPAPRPAPVRRGRRTAA